MADIFVSYKREDRTKAELLAKSLGEQGFSVWWDDEITSRQAWDTVIEQEISAASSVLVLWSPRSISSDWVRTEAHYGQDRGKLIPVLIEACTPPLAFSLSQTLDLCGWSGDETHRHWRKLLTWASDLKMPAEGRAAGTSAAVTANPFRAILGHSPSGEAIVDGAFVNLATPVGTLFQDHIDAPIMRILPQGEFLLGGAPQDPERSNVETPQKRVDISRPFAMSLYPVTQSQYERYASRGLAGAAAPEPAKSRGWFGRTAKAEVVVPAAATDGEVAASHISFGDAKAFLERLSDRAGAHYRLPSETEWEYACRGGSRSRFSWGDEIDPSRAIYRWDGAAHLGPSRPGAFAANGFGLFDMHGNVREWTQDVWHESYDLTPHNGLPMLDGHGAMRVTRGGGWSDPASLLRSSARGRAAESTRSAQIGLRLVRTLD